ncbi:MAG: bifunctional metallophosphatase/5'-nucleotidase [Ignavibacteria bacterium]|nr:bifunctional metallophosphatase/5'-nucleotidase [Ignavibacteria bacterium]MBT8381488.1 bifunctional metallophosphatase/5'-nucleotidase [Ignavibacteria bacterium]MBT8391550.1 bifunctional metallophosphatase/5'-nucleotidase [Ignavibacteria bacterium]NNJ52242.1 bifunctional metallophosphatase/5'-nucleotidase [Ignavibacteriaceae bacterium]NNL22719.1 bifunctional metallophosphatase/5'-nucleotidase [Ignavibacteriaceae bacterium]
MKKLTNTLIKDLIVVFYLSALAFSQTVNVKIIETSDVHGAIVPYDLIKDTTTSSSLAQVHTFANYLRWQKDTEVILLDNGDLLQGDPMSYFYNYEDTNSTHIFAEAMNIMKYDAATIGNHDIETGHPVYDEFKKQINFPWLAANAINTKTNKPYFEPYAIIERKGLKIAVLGLITPAIPNWLPSILWQGIRFDDMVETAAKWVPIIKDKETPDLIVGLFHAGIDHRYNNEEGEIYKNENASQLVAEKVPGFDIVFVGHDHSGWNFKTKNTAGDSVLILGARSRAKTVAVANISFEFNKNTDSWKIKSTSGEIVEIKNYKPDDMFMSKLLIPLNIVKNYVTLPLGQITKTVSSKESLLGPSGFVDLIHTAQLEITNAEVSFVSPLSFNATIDSGWIKVRDMFKLYHYENFLYTMELTGEEIKNYLEYSYGSWFNQMEDENDHLLKFKLDENDEIKYSARYNSPELDERHYNYSSAAGINYTVDVSKPVGERVSITSLSSGEVFELEKTYAIAINSYRGNGGGGHLIHGAGIPKEELSKRIISSTEKDLRFHLMKWIKEKKSIMPAKIGNWKIVPEDWWQKGKEKDYNLIFGKEEKMIESSSLELQNE